MSTIRFREPQRPRWNIYFPNGLNECEKCGATVANLVLTCDDAVEYWNSLNKEGKRVVLERVGEEPCRDVEDVAHDDMPEEMEGVK